MPVVQLPLLLGVMLSGMPVPGAALSTSGLSWVEATHQAALIQQERGLSARPVIGYHDGSPLVLAVVDLSPDGSVRAEVKTALAFLKMADAAKKEGVQLSVVSGYRTQQQQNQLYRLYRKRRGHLASRPGYSKHQSGRALDLDMSLPGVKGWMNNHAHEYGFRRTVPSERWHWEHW